MQAVFLIPKAVLEIVKKMSKAPGLGPYLMSNIVSFAYRATSGGRFGVPEVLTPITGHLLWGTLQRRSVSREP